ncbi:hypothetical protein CRENBAI_003402 [Crenichthys baileyi]|uniref:Uncharacterized protein n=1 Tax=Crenichthys baileyi TaxID=28760 RepID=A0AAV9QXL5_9TELE
MQPCWRRLTLGQKSEGVSMPSPEVSAKKFTLSTSTRASQIMDSFHQSELLIQTSTPTLSLCPTFPGLSPSLPLSLKDSGFRSEHSQRNPVVKMRAVGAAGVAELWAILAVLLGGVVCELVTLVQEQVKPESPVLPPKVMIAILARNAAHSLPHYLGCIERLEYPKERIAIW